MGPSGWIRAFGLDERYHGALKAGGKKENYFTGVHFQSLTKEKKESRGFVIARVKLLETDPLNFLLTALWKEDPTSASGREYSVIYAMLDDHLSKS